MGVLETVPDCVNDKLCVAVPVALCVADEEGDAVAVPDVDCEDAPLEVGEELSVPVCEGAALELAVAVELAVETSEGEAVDDTLLVALPVATDEGEGDAVGVPDGEAPIERDAVGLGVLEEVGVPVALPVKVGDGDAPKDSVAEALGEPVDELLLVDTGEDEGDAVAVAVGVPDGDAPIDRLAVELGVLLEVPDSELRGEPLAVAAAADGLAVALPLTVGVELSVAEAAPELVDKLVADTVLAEDEEAVGEAPLASAVPVAELVPERDAVPLLEGEAVAEECIVEDTETMDAEADAVIVAEPDTSPVGEPVLLEGEGSAVPEPLAELVAVCVEAPLAVGVVLNVGVCENDEDTLWVATTLEVIVPVGLAEAPKLSEAVPEALAEEETLAVDENDGVEEAVGVPTEDSVDDGDTEGVAPLLSVAEPLIL